MYLLVFTLCEIFALFSLKTEFEDKTNKFRDCLYTKFFHTQNVQIYDWQNGN